ncbi:MAG: PhzF family phenazine biosynthesis isomerase [Lutisporaceae bacterium]
MNNIACKNNKLDIYIVDAFTKELYKGNPAAVVVIQEELDEQVMQSIAMELNLSETAFVNISQCENNIYPLRWFTPKIEVPLCGHATIATSKILFDVIGIKDNELKYITKSGILKSRKHQGKISINFPIDQPEEIEAPQLLLQTLGIGKFVNCIYGKQTKKLVIHVSNSHEILDINPDFEKMKNLSFDIDVKGVGVTAQGNDSYDFISRYFNPWAGVNEDFVTGSVHTLLAPYWAKLLGKNELKAYQASSRGGELELRLDSHGRIELLGEAIIVLRGKLEA